MASYYVDSAAAGSASGADWTNAYLTLGAALAVATAADTVYVDDGHAETGTSAITYTCPTTVGLRVVSVDKALGLTPTTVSAGATITQTSGSVGITINGCAHFYGISFFTSTAASGLCVLSIAVSVTGPHFLEFDTCVLHGRGTLSTAGLMLGLNPNLSNDEAQIFFLNTQIGVGILGAGISCRQARIRGVGISLMGTATITSLFKTIAAATADVDITGSNFSAVTYTNLVDGVANTSAGLFRFSQCKLSVAGTALLTSSVTVGNVEVFINDCATGDTHGVFGYANPMGSMITEGTIKFTGGAAQQSWKITTTANASYLSPFYTPWIDYYNATLSALVPYLEVVRTGSATALNDDQIWIETLAKVTASSTASTFATDARGLLAAAAAQATGAGTWDGSPGTPWYGKLAVASLTPAETGHIRARVAVGLASVAGTVYVDPQVRV